MTHAASGLRQYAYSPFGNRPSTRNPRSDGIFWPLTGFSPRKRNMTVYIMPGFTKYKDLMNKLGKHKTSVSCIYFNKLQDINTEVLKQVIRRSVADMKKIYK